MMMPILIGKPQTQSFVLPVPVICGVFVWPGRIVTVNLN
jgi:hypothetical protein